MNTKKIALMMLLLVAASAGAYAQGNGMAGINEATKMVTSYFDSGTKLIYAIGAVVGLIGGIKVYNKFSSGDPDTSKTAASWFGACIFLIVAATLFGHRRIGCHACRVANVRYEPQVWRARTDEARGGTLASTVFIEPP